MVTSMFKQTLTCKGDKGGGGGTPKTDDIIHVHIELAIQVYSVAKGPLNRRWNLNVQVGCQNSQCPIISDYMYARYWILEYEHLHCTTLSIARKPQTNHKGFVPIIL